jgi:hypothetical protein
MAVCLADGAGPEPRCTPVCRNCGRDLVQDESPHLLRDHERTFWQRACGCVTAAPRTVSAFTDEEVTLFSALLAARGTPDDVAGALGRPLLQSLAEHLTKTVLGLPGGDITITADEAREAIGRDLRARPSPDQPSNP